MGLGQYNSLGEYCGPHTAPGGGGVLSLEKGTDCGPTAGEWWLSRPGTAKNGGLSSYHIVG